MHNASLFNFHTTIVVVIKDFRYVPNDKIPPSEIFLSQCFFPRYVFIGLGRDFHLFPHQFLVAPKVVKLFPQ